MALECAQQPGSPMNQAFERLEMVVSILTDRVDSLERRTEPVLAPGPSMADCDKSDPTFPASGGVVLRILEAADATERVSIRLQTILDRLEV